MNFELKTLLLEGWPMLVLLLTAFLAMVTAILPASIRLKATTFLVGLGFLVSLYGFVWEWAHGLPEQVDLLTIDPLGNFLGFVISLIGLITTVFSYRYLLSQKEPFPEFLVLMVFSAVGMVLMTMTTHLLTLVLSLEVMSLALYVLVGIRRQDVRSGEGAFKYFLLGSVATAFMLFGISLLYGATGTMNLNDLPSTLPDPSLLIIARLGVLLIFLGFAFKVAAVPFHFWAPDVYEGAPVPITGFMATGVKVAAFGALLRFVLAMSAWPVLPLMQVLGMMSFATMVIGNILALRQKKLKRIMAYSSISHAGYLLLGFATLLPGGGFRAEAVAPILFYLFAYSLMTLGVFGVFTLLSSYGEEINTLQDLDGLSERHPFLAAFLSLFLISLAGIPPTIGFFAKYFMFAQAIQVGFYPLAIVGMLTSAISLYYYLAPVVRIYFHRSEKPVYPRVSLQVGLIMVVMLFLNISLGIFPTSLLKMVQQTPLLQMISAQ